MAFSDLVQQLDEMDEVADKLRRAARIIRYIRAGVIEQRDGDPDLHVQLTPQQVQNILGPKVATANALITEAKDLAASLVTG